MTKIECEIWENKISCFTKAHREKVTILQELFVDL